jgi:hypothetical protein
MKVLQANHLVTQLLSQKQVKQVPSAGYTRKDQVVKNYAEIFLYLSLYFILFPSGGSLHML